jgi:hypothetical protein
MGRLIPAGTGLSKYKHLAIEVHAEEGAPGLVQAAPASTTAAADVH